MIQNIQPITSSIKLTPEAISKPSAFSRTKEDTVNFSTNNKTLNKKKESHLLKNSLVTLGLAAIGVVVAVKTGIMKPIEKESLNYLQKVNNKIIDITNGAIEAISKKIKTVANGLGHKEEAKVESNVASTTEKFKQKNDIANAVETPKVETPKVEVTKAEAPKTVENTEAKITEQTKTTAKTEEKNVSKKASKATAKTEDKTTTKAESKANKATKNAQKSIAEMTKEEKFEEARSMAKIINNKIEHSEDETLEEVQEQIIKLKKQLTPVQKTNFEKSENLDEASVEDIRDYLEIIIFKKRPLNRMKELGYSQDECREILINNK